MNIAVTDIPGFLGLATDLRARIDALGEPDAGIPTTWTPEHVATRMVEAFEVLSRSGARVGPKQYGNGWPAMVHEFADMVDAQARLLAEKEKLQAKAARPTADELSRMDEALRWPSTYLGNRALAADSLTLWAYALATGRDMAAMLSRRKKRAIAKAEEMMRRANAPPHINPETGDVMDTRSAEVLAANAMRQRIAREVAASCNERLARAPRTSHAEIRRQAQMTFKARCKDACCLPLVVKPTEAIPGRVMARTTLDRHRKIAAAVIAEALASNGVVVR